MSYQDLILTYAKIIQAMELYRSIDTETYKQLDERRAELHNQILQVAGKTRDDNAFRVKLALQVDELLSKRD